MATWASLSLQNSASPSMEQLIFFHDFTMMIIMLITTLVLINLPAVTLSSLSNRHLLQEHFTEVLWTIYPVIILLTIALPSLQALYLLDDPFTPDLTIKTTGHQWFWSYEYSDFPDLSFDSYMLPLTSPYQINRLLETDNSMIIPINSQVRLIATSSDVIHSWALPSLGVKADALPGRLNQLMLSFNRTGVFFGQCSEICGANHSFMPIKVEAVPMSTFISWASSIYI